MNRACQVSPYPGAGCPQAGRLAFGAGVDWTDIGYTLATPPNFRPPGSHKENPKKPQALLGVSFRSAGRTRTYNLRINSPTHPVRPVRVGVV